MSLHRSVVTVANTKSKAATVWGELGGVKAEVMPDFRFLGVTGA